MRRWLNRHTFFRRLDTEIRSRKAGDFRKLLGKVERAIVEKRAGDFVIRADIGAVRTGVLQAGGQGLYLPVWADGSARVEYRPH